MKINLTLYLYCYLQWKTKSFERWQEQGKRGEHLTHWTKDITGHGEFEEEVKQEERDSIN